MKGVTYPRGVQDTWMRLWEIVATMPGIEYADTDYIAYLLALPPPPPAPATSSSEGSNSVIVVSLDNENEELSPSVVLEEFENSLCCVYC